MCNRTTKWIGDGGPERLNWLVIVRVDGGGKGQLEALNWDRVAKSTDWSGIRSQNGVLLEGERLNRVPLIQEDSATTFNETCIVCFFYIWVVFMLLDQSGPKLYIQVLLLTYHIHPGGCSLLSCTLKRSKKANVYSIIGDLQVTRAAEK